MGDLPGTPRETGSYLELTIGRFRCALRADCVLGVATDQRAAEGLRLRDEALTLVDLRTQFRQPASEIVPFVVALEAAGMRTSVGVDAVGHVRRERLELTRMPRFGLERPGLFAWALRSSGDLLPVLDPMHLVTLGAGG